MTGMKSSPGCRSRSVTSWVLPNWMSAVVFPVPAGPDTIRPRRPLTVWRLSRISRLPVLTTCRRVEVAITVSRVW